MKICVYSAKGGEGKTPIATNIVLDRQYAIGTNEHFHLFDTFIPDNRVLALEPDQGFPEIPNNIDIVFDLAGSISANSGSIVSALKQANLVIVPITNEVKAIYGGIGTIQEILRFCSNVLVVATKLEKGRKEKFNKNGWYQSAAFLNIKSQVQSTEGLEHIPCLPLKYSKAFDAIFEKELSIAQIMEADPLAKYNNISMLKPTEDQQPVLSERQTQLLKKTIVPKAQRINKGFQVEKGRAAKWDLLVAQMKSAENKRTGPELIDEALDYLFDKYH